MKNERFILVVLCVFIAICLFLLPHLYPTVTVGCFFGKNIEVNLFIPLAVLLILVTVIAGLSFYLRGPWWIPSLLFTIIGFLIAGFYTYYAYQDLIKSRGSPYEIDLAQTALTVGGFIAAIFAIILTAFGLYLAGKLQKLHEIEKMSDSITDLTRTSAELAFATLPDFSRSHQIPEESYQSLKMICDSVFRPESLLFRRLNEEHKGANLRYANGLRLFAENGYNGAKDEFQSVIDDRTAEVEVKNNAQYWLGVTYRQFCKYGESIDCFVNLVAAGRTDTRNRIKARFGIAITLFAAHKNKAEWWDKWFDKKNKERILEKIYDAFDGHELPENPDGENPEVLKEYALSLIQTVVNIQRENRVAQTYLVKIACHPGNAIPQEDDGTIRGTAEAVEAFLKKQAPTSLNIRASYHLVEGLLRKYLGRSQDQVREALTLAKDAAEEYKDLGGAHVTIFSEKHDKQVSVDKFINEVDEYLSGV